MGCYSRDVAIRMNSLDNNMEHVVAEFSISIEKAIAKSDWDTLNDVLRERQNALERFFSNLKKGEKSLEIKKMIYKIQQEDAVFLRLVQAQKKEMKKQYTSLKQGRKSVKAYQQL